MWKFFIKILTGFFTYFLLFTKSNYRKNTETKISFLKRNIYSTWISVRYKFGKVSFLKPINLIKGAQYFKIGEGTGFGKMVVLTAWDVYEGIKYKPEVTIGQKCNFGDYLHLTCIDKIKIGDNVLTGRWVTISDNSHGETDPDTLKLPPSKRPLSCKGSVIIGDNVWIGDKATILSGVTIGEGAVIAANSVVTKSVPPYSVAAGNPAKIIKSPLLPTSDIGSRIHAGDPSNPSINL